MISALQQHRDLIWSLIQKVAILFAIIFVLSFTIRSIGEETLRNAVDSAGLYGPLALFMVIFLKGILAPLAGGGILATSTVIFGLWTTFIVAFIAHLLACIVNYYLAKKFGRKIVQKILGEEVFVHVVKMEESLKGRFWLVFVFGIFTLDFVGYAAGFMNIHFKKYIPPLILAVAVYIGLNVWLGESIFTLIEGLF